MSIIQITQIDLGQLSPSPHNPRGKLDRATLAELAESIKAQGVLEPLLVRPKGKGYEILAGHRREAAADIAGLASVPCIIRDVDDKTAIEITVTENLQREQLSPIEEAQALKSLAEAGWDAETMAAELGKSAKWVARRKSLLGLEPSILKAVQGGVPLKIKGRFGAVAIDHLPRWPAASLERLASVPAEAQLTVLIDVHENSESLPPLPAQVSASLADLLKTLSAAPFDKTDATLNPKQGACTTCDQRASCRKSLFDDAPDAEDGKIPRNDRCLNPVCFAGKMLEHSKRAIAKARAEHKGLRICADSIQSEERKALKAEYRPYGLVKVKAADKGAQPWFDLDKGKVEYFAPSRTVRESKQGSKPGAEKAVPLKQRREQLERRRMAMVLAGIRDLVGQMAGFPATVTYENALLLLLVFGSDSADDVRGDLVDESHLKAARAAKLSKNPWRRVDELNAVPPSTRADVVREVAFDRVMPVLLSRLDYYQPSSIDLKEHGAEAEEICKLVNLDYADLCSQAEREIPEPKSWTSLNADGTPKTTKPKAPKQAKEGKPRPKRQAGGK